ncbi:MAG: glycosyltransferase family 2 protein [Thermoproteota archaeon]|nr:glycosyltransferase family 2 protein [Thermoproteota archaeon]
MEPLTNNSHKVSANDTKQNAIIMAIIPAYDESQNIAEIVSETAKYVTSVIVIDDGSHDNTAEVAASMNAKVIRNRHNSGKGAALKRGLVECLKYNPDIVVTIDADGQHDPSDIPKLLEPIKNEEADIVIGSRYGKSIVNLEVPRYRRFGLSFIDFMNKSLVRSPIEDTQSGFRVYAKDVLSMMAHYSSTGFGAETEQLATAELYGLRIIEIPVMVKYKGLNKTSKQNALLQGAHIISTIFHIAVERRPLLFFGASGIILMIAAAFITIIVARLYSQSTYFSVPLTLIALGFVLLGFMLILISLVLYELKRIREHWNVRRY